jgi:hypothetical protein
VQVEEVAAAGVAARSVDVTLGERQDSPDEQPAKAGDRHLVEQKPETEAQIVNERWGTRANRVGSATTPTLTR